MTQLEPARRRSALRPLRHPPGQENYWFWYRVRRLTRILVPTLALQLAVLYFTGKARPREVIAVLAVWIAGAGGGFVAGFVTARKRSQTNALIRRLRRAYGAALYASPLKPQRN